MAVLKTDASRKAGNCKTGGWFSTREMTAPGKGGEHVLTGLAVNANHCLSHTHRFLPRVQHSTLQAIGPIATANPASVSESYHHQHGATKHHFSCYSQTPAALFKQTSQTHVIDPRGVSDYTQHSHTIDLSWNGMPGLYCLSSTACKFTWRKVLDHDLHIGTLITTSLGPSY